MYIRGSRLVLWIPDQSLNFSERIGTSLSFLDRRVSLFELVTMININKTDKERFLYGLPLYLLVLIAVYSLIVGISMNMYFTWKIYAGFISILFFLLLFLLYFKWFNYLFLFVLLLGCFNLLQFTFNNVTISFYFGLFKRFNIDTIEIQLLSFVVLLLFILLNLKKIVKLIKHLLRD